MTCIFYIVQANRGEPAMLAVKDQGKEEYHLFPFSIINAARLNRETAELIHSHLTGFDDKRAAREIAAHMADLEAQVRK